MMILHSCMWTFNILLLLTVKVTEGSPSSTAVNILTVFMNIQNYDYYSLVNRWSDTTAFWTGTSVSWRTTSADMQCNKIILLSQVEFFSVQ